MEAILQPIRDRLAALEAENAELKRTLSVV
jgi:hypothetical protein